MIKKMFIKITTKFMINKVMTITKIGTLPLSNRFFNFIITNYLSINN